MALAWLLCCVSPHGSWSYPLQRDVCFKGEAAPLIGSSVLTIGILSDGKEVKSDIALALLPRDTIVFVSCGEDFKNPVRKPRQAWGSNTANLGMTPRPQTKRGGRQRSLSASSSDQSLATMSGRLKNMAMGNKNLRCLVFKVGLVFSAATQTTCRMERDISVPLFQLEICSGFLMTALASMAHNIAHRLTPFRLALVSPARRVFDLNGRVVKDPTKVPICDEVQNLC